MSPRFMEQVSPVNDGRVAMLSSLEWVLSSLQRAFGSLAGVESFDWFCNSSSFAHIFDHSFSVNLTAFDNRVLSTTLPTKVTMQCVTLGLAFLLAKMIFVKRYSDRIVHLHGRYY